MSLATGHRPQAIGHMRTFVHVHAICARWTCTCTCCKCHMLRCTCRAALLCGLDKKLTWHAPHSLTPAGAFPTPSCAWHPPLSQVLSGPIAINVGGVFIIEPLGTVSATAVRASPFSAAHCPPTDRQSVRVPADRRESLSALPHRTSPPAPRHERLQRALPPLPSCRRPGLAPPTHPPLAHAISPCRRVSTPRNSSSTDISSRCTRSRRLAQRTHLIAPPTRARGLPGASIRSC